MKTMMQSMTSNLAVLFALLAALAGAPALANELTVQQVTPQLGGENTELARNVQFPNPEKTWLSRPAFVDVANLRRMGHGMNKNQVRELISYPHFNEGLFGSSVWNYLFAFRTGKDNESMVCQYQLHFDNDGITKAIFWDRAACADVLKPSIR